MSNNNHEPSDLLRRLLEASANSPLTEADPKSTDELMSRIQRIFNTRPLELSNNDIVDIVLYFRLKRAMFAQLAKEKADEPKRSRKKATTTVVVDDSEEIQL